MERERLAVRLRWKEKVIPFRVTLGEPFKFFVTSAVKQYFPELKDYAVLHGDKDIPCDTKVAECHIGLEFTLKEQRTMTVLTPFQQKVPCTVSSDETVQMILNLAASRLCVTIQHLQVFQSGKRKEANESVRSLSSELIEIRIVPLYPTVYVIEKFQVTRTYTWSSWLSIAEIKRDVCAFSKILESEIVMVMEGQRAMMTSLQMKNSFLFAVRIPRGIITVLIKWEGKPEIAMDLTENMTGSEAKAKIAKKLDKNVDLLNIIFYGKTLGTDTVKNSGITHGSQLWAVGMNGKRRVLLKSLNGTKSIDVLPSDTIATVMSLYSKKAKIPVARLSICHNSRPLSDSQGVPSECFDSRIYLEVVIRPQIYIRHLSGILHKVALNKDMSTEELKTRLVADKIIPSPNCLLKFENEVLTPEKKLSEAGVKDKSVLDADCL